MQIPHLPSFNNRVSAHRHLNGGGWVADTAKVADTVYIGPYTQVAEDTIILDHARIDNYATIFGKAKVSGNAYIGGKTIVGGNAIISGRAYIDGYSVISSDAKITGGDFLHIVFNDGVCNAYPLVDGSIYFRYGNLELPLMYLTRNTKRWSAARFNLKDLKSFTIGVTIAKTFFKERQVH